MFFDIMMVGKYTFNLCKGIHSNRSGSIDYWYERMGIQTIKEIFS